MRKDHLVPIQIDLDVDSFKVRDAFVWNANGRSTRSRATQSLTCTPTEREITADTFAHIFCDDLDIPHSHAEEIAAQIKTQVNEQAGIAEIPFRSAEDEAESVEKDLRVVLSVSFPPPTGSTSRR